VLQIEQVFTNVPKGLVAKKEDWTKAFNTDDMNKVIEEVCAADWCGCVVFANLRQILRKGDLQINNLERTHQLSDIKRELTTLVSEMTIDPDTHHKHTTGMIEKAMAEVNFVVKADKPAKAQALELIRRLQSDDSPLKVQRVRMRIRITMPSKDAKRIKEKVMAEVEEVEDEDTGAEWEAIVHINPSAFRTLTDMVNDETKGKGRVESMGSVGS